MNGFDITPNVQLRGINPQGFVPQTPEMPAGDPFSTAANALLSGLIVGEAEGQRRQAEQKQFAMAEAQFQETIRQFEEQKELSMMEANAMVAHRRDMLDLQKKNFALDQEKWTTNKEALELGMEQESFLLGEHRREAQKSINSDRKLKGLFDEVSQTRSATDVKVTTFADYVDAQGNLIAVDPIDNSKGAFGADTARTAGVSLNQKSVEAAFPGLSKSEQARIKVAIKQNGEVIGTLPLVDRGPADWVLQREGRQVIDITPMGIEQLGGKVKTKDGKVVGLDLPGQIDFELVHPDFTPSVSTDQGPPLPVDVIMGPGQLPNAAIAPPSNPYFQAYEKLERALVDPDINEEGNVRIQQQIQQLTHDPQVRSAVNKKKAEETAHINHLPDPIAKVFIQEAERAPLLMDDDARLAMMRGIVGNAEAKAEASKDAGPVELPAKREDDIRNSLSAWNMINNMSAQWEAMPDSELGRIQGPLAQFINYVWENPGLTLAEASSNPLLPQIAKSMFGDSGVLSNQDIARAAMALPRSSNSKETNRALVQALQRVVLNDVRSGVQMDKLMGRDWAGVVGILENAGLPLDQVLGPNEVKELTEQSISNQIIDALKTKGLINYEIEGNPTFERTAGGKYTYSENGLVVFTADTPEELLNRYNAAQ